MRRLFAVTLLLLAACAHYPVNPKLDRTGGGYRYSNVRLPRKDGTFIILTFSGGGSRAAGFAYGVLRELDKTRLPDGSSVLDHVDVISSVSGGSFTSMYYGLHGREGFASFEDRFLKQDIQGLLFRTAFLNPKSWFRLLSPHFSRIDLAAEVYDKVLFDDKTFAELLATQQQAGRPLIVANSTELDLGSRFEWTQDQFDPICSDLSQVHVSRAVAASSAFPGLLTPMVVKNYTSEGCGYATPPWVANARDDADVNPERFRFSTELLQYLNRERSYLHLMDGGIADNIGLRGPLHAVISSDTLQAPGPDGAARGFTLLPDINRGDIRRLLVITVAAGTESLLRFDKVETNPGTIATFSTVANTPLGNYSFDTLNLLRTTFAVNTLRDALPDQCQDAARANCPEVKIPGAGQKHPTYYPVVIGFSSVKDAELRKRLNDIGTNFSITGPQLQDLMTAGAQLLQQSDDFQQFLKDARQ
ncbi:MAG TPA: patatin-like phospholipase family protein [Thermoanaerobaculia bacterium]|nr:patatin-like phospholipase family protein [Thermoanaerobaculia bacterium]